MLFITFAISIGFVFKLADLLARGVTWLPIVQLFLYSMPTSVVTAIPLGALVSCLLLYGRLSDDGEIMAMRSLGLGMGQIVRSTLAATGVLVAMALWINHEVEPAAHFARRSQDAALRNLSPLELLEEGRFFRAIPGLTIYVGKKKGSEVQGVRIYDSRDPDLVREIHAQTGRVETGSGGDLVMELDDVRISPFSRDMPKPVYLQNWSFAVKHLSRTRTYRPDEEDMGLPELLYRLWNVRDVHPHLGRDDLKVQRMIYSYELNRRTALAFSPLALVLVGIPLGIRAHRKSAGAGVGLSLLVFFAFYVMSLLTQSLEKVPSARPDLLVWAPVIVFGALGGWLLRRRG
jgi:lipopolysaccharide export LptBFGC system permease protein LptF